MTDTIKVVSTRTVIKKVTVGTPIPHPTVIKIKTSVSELTDVTAGGVDDGYMLVYDDTAKKWEVSNTLNKQIIDGQEGF